MTTIAWDGKTRAVDRGVWKGRLVGEVRKLHIFKDGESPPNWPAGAWAAAGNSGVVAEVLLWAAGKVDRPAEANSSLGLFVDARGQAYEVSARFTLAPLRQKFTADGAGAEFAMGCLAAGATAEEAIGYAMQHTDCAAGGIDVWSPT